MTKQSSIRLGAVGLMLTALLVSFFLRNTFFPGSGGKLYKLLHHNKVMVAESDSETIYNGALVKSYYDHFGYSTLWTDRSSKNEDQRKWLIEMLNSADELGLDKENYHHAFISHYDSLAEYPNFDHAQNESENELIFTDGALSFLHDVAYGKEIQVSYNGLKYYVDSNKLINSLNQILEKGNWENGLMSLEPSLKQYAGLKKELGSMQRFAGSMENTDTMVVSVAADYKKAVSLKLQVYGLLPSSDQAATDLALHNAVMEFQKKVNLPPTGELDEKVIAALNFPLFERVEQIKQSLNYWRWTSRIKQPEFIMVNIPAARLQVVAIDAPEKNISMKVIVGKPITQTPPFAAYIYRVITYPYWTVPLSIATKEMLPKIINKVTYLEDNSLHVLDNKGEELNPSDIKWRKYSNNNFPFTIRQSTGCDNSLGILKFDINSPYAIYLHDTNLRGLFEKENRFLSHGCVRVEKPIELARYILGKEFDKDIEEHLNRCLKGEEPAEIRLKEKLPVLIFYMPADIDENGALKFYPDVYEIGKKGFSTSNVATPGEVGLPD